MRSRDSLGQRLPGSLGNGQGEDEGQGRLCEGRPGPCLHVEPQEDPSLMAFQVGDEST